LTRVHRKAIFARKIFIRGNLENCQPGILLPVPIVGSYLKFSLRAGAELRQSLLELIKIADGTTLVVGIGQPTTFALKRTVPELRPFPTQLGAARTKAGLESVRTLNLMLSARQH
jgi:hypothetical protein